MLIALNHWSYGSSNLTRLQGLRVKQTTREVAFAETRVFVLCIRLQPLDLKNAKKCYIVIERIVARKSLISAVSQHALSLSLKMQLMRY